MALLRVDVALGEQFLDVAGPGRRRSAEREIGGAGVGLQDRRQPKLRRRYRRLPHPWPHQSTTHPYRAGPAVPLKAGTYPIRLPGRLSKAPGRSP